MKLSSAWFFGQSDPDSSSVISGEITITYYDAITHM